MGILKEGFSAYSSPVMLISRKLTQDKRDLESEELDDSAWQMLSQVETSPFQDFDMWDLNM